MNRGSIRTNAVNLDNGQDMVIDVEVLPNKGTNVDQTKHICSIRLDWNAAVQRIIEEERLRQWFCSSRIVDRLERWPNLLGHLMVPVTHRDGNVLVIHISKVRIFIVDDECLSIAVRIAVVDMAVIPICPVLIDREVVGEVVAGWYGALRDHRRTVHLVGAVLIHAMEVDAGILVAQAVVHVDDKLVAFVDFDDWERPLIVDANDLPLGQAIRVCSHPCEIEVVGDCLCRAGYEQGCNRCEE